MKRNVLVTSEVVGSRELARLSRAATVYQSWTMGDEDIVRVLPDIDVLVVFGWPNFLTKESLTRMKRLKFLQSILVGVDQIPFESLDQKVVVSSNAGAYSLEVGEHAWALLLAAEKKIVEHHMRIRSGAKSLGEFAREGSRITVLEGKTLGVVGYGSIGRSVAKIAQAFQMKVLAWGRSGRMTKGVTTLNGRSGFERLLRESDVVLLSLPLTRSTLRLIGQRELSMMKGDAAIVNVARGDLADQEAIYSHLASHPDFKYATDAWWFKEGRETLQTDFPLAQLPNFVGTPHTSGPTGVSSGRPGRLAVDNVIRYLRGLTPKHIVDRAEYSGM